MKRRLLIIALSFSGNWAVQAQGRFSGGSGDGYSSASVSGITTVVEFATPVAPSFYVESNQDSYKLWRLGPTVEPMQILLYHLDGRLAFSGLMQENQLQLPALPEGIYLLLGGGNKQKVLLTNSNR